MMIYTNLLYTDLYNYAIITARPQRPYTVPCSWLTSSLQRLANRSMSGAPAGLGMAAIRRDRRTLQINVFL